MIIGFEHHEVRCIIGTEPSEQTQEQEIYFDIKVEASHNFEQEEDLDKLENTIDYRLLADLCTRKAQQHHYHLLEALATDILNSLFRNYNICWAWVKIKKPKALPSAHCATIEIERRIK